MSRALMAVLLVGCAKSVAPTAIDPTVPLIPRTELFGNPERTSAQIRPDGQQIGFLAEVDGVLNVWVAPTDDLDAAEALTSDAGRGIRFWGFLHNNTHLVYIQDVKGDENWRLHLVDLESGDDRVVTPEQPGVAARVMATSPAHPNTLLLGLNDRDPRFHDVHRFDVTTGETTLVYQNDEYASFEFDEDLELRLATKMTPDGGLTYFQRDGDTFEPVATFDQVDTMSSNSVAVVGNRWLTTDSRGRDTGALAWIDLETGEAEQIGASELADVGSVMVSDVSREVLGYAVEHVELEWVALDEAFAADLEVARTLGPGRLSIGSVTADESKWIWSLVDDDNPVTTYLYDRSAQSVRPLFTTRPDLDDAPLVPMHGEVIPSRDGLELVSYLTLPAGADSNGDFRPEVAQPLVLLVHGGPWARDRFGFNAYHQWLANRGYAVLSVNFRGSTGFGKAFVNAGDQQWGRKMHDDLIDAVDWAVSEGITTPDEVAIMGGSYGGYATLAGLTFTPQRFACGVDIVGPSNLETLLASIPPYWAPLLEMFATRVADPRTEEGRAMLRERSPLHAVDAIQRPLLIAQGANDPRVKQAESDQIVDAMRERGIPVTYALFPDEGHGFARPENNLAFTALSEAFLAECLGGRAEPFGDVISASSIEVPEGAEHVPGLAEALAEE